MVRSPFPQSREAKQTIARPLSGAVGAAAKAAPGEAHGPRQALTEKRKPSHPSPCNPITRSKSGGSTNRNTCTNTPTVIFSPSPLGQGSGARLLTVRLVGPHHPGCGQGRSVETAGTCRSTWCPPPLTSSVNGDRDHRPRRWTSSRCGRHHARPAHIRFRAGGCRGAGWNGGGRAGKRCGVDAASAAAGWSVSVVAEGTPRRWPSG